jgi:hypothetical protein
MNMPFAEMPFAEDGLLRTPIPSRRHRSGAGFAGA